MVDKFSLPMKCCRFILPLLVIKPVWDVIKPCYISPVAAAACLLKSKLKEQQNCFPPHLLGWVGADLTQMIMKLIRCESIVLVVCIAWI